MSSFVEQVRAQLREVFAGRSVVVAGGVSAAAVEPINELRRLGAQRFLVVSANAGTGVGPEGPDVEVFMREIEFVEYPVEGFREEERALADPSPAARAAIERFDPNRDAVVLVPPFLDVRALGDRRAFGARRSEWVALEDKTHVDDLFDAARVPHPTATVVAADPTPISEAARALDAGAGTVWSGDARDGFNGGAGYVRWVRDPVDAREALEFLGPRCDRVRVAPFVEGVPCSVHGFVVDDGVAAFRPVELLTLRAARPPALRFFGCATFFDPPAAAVTEMRAAAVRVGEHLREEVGYRGAFTLDGIAAADGWVATECNPRFGAGLGYVEAALPDLPLMLLHYAVVEGVVDVPSAELERTVVEAATRVRWGSVSSVLRHVITETSTIGIAGDAGGFRRVDDGGEADAAVSIGPGRTGGHVRIALDARRIAPGPSIAPLAAAALSCADRELGLGLGPLTPARPV